MTIPHLTLSQGDIVTRLFCQLPIYVRVTPSRNIPVALVQGLKVHIDICVCTCACTCTPLGAGGCPRASHSCLLGQEWFQGCSEPADVQGKAEPGCPLIPGPSGRVGVGLMACVHPPLGWRLWPAERGFPENPELPQPLRAPAAASPYHPALWTSKNVA